MYPLFLIAMLLAPTATAQTPEEFRFSVEREKTLRDERGDLVINADGIFYKSQDGDTLLRIPFTDVYEADVSDRSIVRIETYDVLKRRFGGRRTYTFRVRGATHDDRLAQFLTAHLNRPVLGSYGTAGESTVTVAAYHRHTLGGCNGRIEMGVDTIRFISDKPSHSRTWRYQDMETIGSSDPFDFRVSTFAETYRFDLKERLPEKAYEAAWQRIYQLPRKYSRRLSQ
jgi:hypothetical protein